MLLALDNLDNRLIAIAHHKRGVQEGRAGPEGGTERLLLPVDHRGDPVPVTLQLRVRGLHHLLAGR